MENYEIKHAFKNLPDAGLPNNEPVMCRGNLELYHKLNAAYVMTIAAEQRKESRGSHYRADYPEIKEEFSSPIVIKRTGIKL